MSKRFPYSPTERGFRRLARSAGGSARPPSTRGLLRIWAWNARFQRWDEAREVTPSSADFWLKHEREKEPNTIFVALTHRPPKLRGAAARLDPSITPRRAEVIARSHAAFEREREAFHPKRFKRGGGYTPEEMAEIAKRAGLKKRPSTRALGKLDLHRFLTERPERVFAYYKDDARVGAAITNWPGDVLGHVIWRGTVTRRGRWPGARMVNIRMRAVTGDVYAGTCQLDAGTYCRLKKVKGGGR